MKLLLTFSLLIPLLRCDFTTTEEFDWSDDLFNDTVAVNGSRPSEKIADLILKDYVRSVTPPSEGPVEIFFDVGGIYLAKVLSNQRSVTAILGIQMKWKDPRLKWNPSDHSNVTEIYLPDYSVWLPPFYFYNSIKYKYLQNEKARLARISHDGGVYYYTGTSITASCWLGFAYFPFDIQECIMALSSPLLGSDDVVARPGTVFFSQGNDEFDIKNVSLSTYNFTEFGVDKFELDLTILMVRHSLYYVIVLIIPTALLSFIATAGFFSADTTNCIMDIVFSCLLTITMLLEILSNMLPKSSELPLLGYYITASLVVISISAFLSIFIAILQLKVERCDIETTPPKWLMKMCCARGNGLDEQETIPLRPSFRIFESEHDELTRWIKLFIQCAYSTVDRMREELQIEETIESWRLVFRRCRFILFLIFELVHFSFLVALLSYWGKENFSPTRLRPDGLPL